MKLNGKCPKCMRIFTQCECEFNPPEETMTAKEWLKSKAWPNGSPSNVFLSDALKAVEDVEIMLRKSESILAEVLKAIDNKNLIIEELSKEIKSLNKKIRQLIKEET